MTNELIYGISSKCDFGKWSHWIFVFDNEEEANEWLKKETYDFRNRELFTSEYKAIRLLGKGGKKRLAEARAEFGF